MKAAYLLMLVWGMGAPLAQARAEDSTAGLGPVPFSQIKEDPQLRRQWWDMVWKAFPSTPERYHPDFTDFRKGAFFKAPPAPGVHPRVYLRPETLKELRVQVREDAAKRTYFDIYKQNCEQLYRKDGVKDLFEAFLTGRSTDAVAELFKSHSAETANFMLWESLRILVEDDRAAGEKLATAIDHYATRLHQVYADRKVEEEKFYENHRNLPDYMQDKVLGDKRYQDITGYFQQYNICFMYDFLYPYMTDAQRANVRSLISKLTTNIWIHGMGIADTGGNWGPHHWKGAMAALAIEGEEGYDPDATEGLRQVMTSYYSGDFTEAGMVWEGLGKGTIAPDGIIVAANRGWDLAANQNIRRAVSAVLMNCTLPDRENVLALGGLGSTHRKLSEYARNALILKHYYPDDPVLDYLMRIYLGEGNENLKSGRGFNHHYGQLHTPLVSLICMSAYDEDKTFAQAQQDAVAAFGTTFFCPEFSLLTTRTDWSRDAAWLAFTARTYNYGHCRNDRGMFTFASHGRQWSLYPWGRGGDEWGNSYAAQNCSVMSIDKHGTLGGEVRMVGFESREVADFATADLKHSWDWRTSRHANPTDSLSPLTQAKLQPLYKGKAPYRDLSFSLYPHWLQPGEPISPDYRVPYFPVEHAYRTVGLIKHRHPYAVILDDLKKDDQARLYTWHMTTEADVVLEKQTGNTVLLGEKEGTRKLLIHVFDSENPERVFSARMLDMWMGISSASPVRQLQISTVAPGVRLKVLLYPYDAAGGPPGFRAELEGERLTVTYPDGRDHYDFAVDAWGMSQFKANIGKEKLRYEVAHTPLPGKGPGEESDLHYEVK